MFPLARSERFQIIPKEVELKRLRSALWDWKRRRESVESSRERQKVWAFLHFMQILSEKHQATTNRCEKKKMKCKRV